MTTKTSADILSEEFDNLLTDIDSLLRTAGDLTGVELKETLDKLYARIAEAKESVESASGDLARKARKSAKRVDREVHAEPWKAIGIGAAVGLLLGLVLARR